MAFSCMGKAVLETLSGTCIAAAAQMREAARCAQSGNCEATLVLIAEVIELLRTGASSSAASAASAAEENFAANRPRQNRGATLSTWRAKRIVVEIESRLALPLRVSDLARVAGLSDSHFSRAFRGYFGVTVHLYITIRRIAAAQELMLSARQSLAEIALRCGMCDQAHFSRVFRRVVGETPNRWRRSRAPDSLLAQKVICGKNCAEPIWVPKSALVPRKGAYSVNSADV
jgi:AraC-like DNA-binding protein